MRKPEVLMLLLLLISCTDSAKWDSEQKTDEQPELSTYQKQVNSYQDSMNSALLSGANMVLKPGQLQSAHPISFFPANESYRCDAKFEKIEKGEVFEMKTSTDRLPLYKRFGILHFKLGEDSLQLTLYQNMEHPDYLFCPFKDRTSGKESYGGGRYIDFSLSDTLQPVIDFNYSYNPYCAYNADYSCPIPPFENHLQVRIEAGVKSWH